MWWISVSFSIHQTTSTTDNTTTECFSTPPTQVPPLSLFLVSISSVHRQASSCSLSLLELNSVRSVSTPKHEACQSSTFVSPPPSRTRTAASTTKKRRLRNAENEQPFSVTPDSASPAVVSQSALHVLVFTSC